MKSKSDKRLIIECKVNNKPANFLIDTGASIALIDNNQVSKYSLIRGRKYNGVITGAGGNIEDTYICNTFAYISNKPLTQFILADIENIVDSIEKETKIKILGIISLPQMKTVGIQIDANDNEIILE